MKEELLEAIYGTVERLEQKVDELSASPKNTEAESTPVPVSVDTSKLEKAILAMAAKEEEVYWQIGKIKRGYLHLYRPYQERSKQRRTAKQTLV